MATAFTPAPWSIDGIGLVVAAEPAEHGEFRAIAQVRHNARANARLISAAPELYEMLAVAVGIINAAGIMWLGGDKADALLAKARGEQVSA